MERSLQVAAFFARIVETEGSWGPFLVVVPAAYVRLWAWTLQWACPLLVTIPYCQDGYDRLAIRRRLLPA